MELLPIVMACVIWGPRWRQSAVTAQCDNEGAVAVVNSGYSRVPPEYFYQGPLQDCAMGGTCPWGTKHLGGRHLPG